MQLHSVVVVSLVAALAVLPAAHAQAPAATTLLQNSARAMGGLAALRAVNNQIVESEGKQFDSSSTQQPLGATRQISTFRYTLTRDLSQPKLRLEWDGRNSARNENVRFVEVIDGNIGMLQEGAGKQTRLHPGRMATRLREELRNPVKLVLAGLAHKGLQRRADAELDGKTHAVVSFVENGDEFRVYLDPQSHLPTQVEILESDPLEGDSNYTLRYGDWRKVGALTLPHNLRYELNGKALLEEQIKSFQNNVSFVADPFAIPDAVRQQKTDTAPIASQWILRRVAGNVSYLDFGRPPTVEWQRLADGVHKITGTGHATILVEMNYHLVAIEGPLYDMRTKPVVQSIKEKFPNKPIRYAIPTHHHLDHAGGIRAFMAEGATIVVPLNAQNFYTKVARAAHSRKPDSLERTRTGVVIESFGGGPRILTDGARRVEIHPLPTSHADDLVVVYLPGEKILIEADHISPRNGQVRTAPLVKEFVDKLDKLGLDVATIVGIHGDQASLQAARAAAKIDK
ncbi:MAG: MBL fold metallo-hydrolase [Deltaproteobacteria bacterium]|nr:MBL fold metallo-hydrolase [Deltaproteobacteria bacterium]